MIFDESNEFEKDVEKVNTDTNEPNAPEDNGTRAFFEETDNNNTDSSQEPSAELYFSQSESDKVEDNTENTDEFSDASPAENISDVTTKQVNTPDFGGGIYYSKDNGGVPTNGYEWDESHTENEVKKTVKTKKKSSGSGRGFKVFMAATLSVFTLSVVALTILVASFAFDSDNSYSPADSASAANNKNSDNYDYSNVTIEKPNFVAFDFKEHEGQVLSIPEIAAKCTPSSVGIISEIETTYNSPFYFSPTTRIAEASGSGFIYSADGYIITNHHVIEDASKITVVLFDGNEYEATLVGSDDLSDIAVLKITPDENTKLIPMEIGNSDDLVVGEPVVAIGCPAGVEFIGTVTDGIISAINRNVELTDSYGTVEKTMTLIQTNATINHGNSGGPLINAKGQVIGINTLKLSSNYEGIGFSIPMNGASPIISQLIEHGKVVERTDEDFAYGKGMIGINGTEISDDEAEYYGIPKGVLVVQIDRGSSASAAGLRRGDIITHYNGTKVSTVEEINNLKGSARAGTQVTLTVYRDGDDGKGETFDIVFKLDAQN